MKRQVVIVTGSRHWTDREAIYRRLGSYPPGTTVIHGNCEGADLIADEAARKYGFEVLPIPYYEIDEKEARNALMIAIGVAFRDLGPYDVTVEAFPLPTSRGTKKCMRLGREAGLPVWDKERP